jgi:ribosome-associated translation inhibitor RaiA
MLTLEFKPKQKMCMSVFKKVFTWVKKQVVSRDRFEMLVLYSDVAVKITAALKKFVDGKVDNFIASQIPGVKDDALVALLENVVPKFALKVAIVNSILRAGQKNQDPVLAIAKHINSLSMEGKEEFYAKFAARLVIDIAEAKSDGVFEFAEVLAISQARFLELKQAGLLK